MASQTSPDKVPQAPNEHPTTHHPNDEPQSDDDDTSTIYFEANTRPSSPSHEYTITNLKHEFAKVYKERLEIMNRLSPLEHPPSPEPTPLEKKLESLEVSFILVTVINYISGYNYGPARTHARTALQKAQELGNEILVARCHYWMGRIEFELQNFAAAYAYFRAAQPCVMDEMYPEGQSVKFYEEVSRSGISEAYRRRAVLEHNHSIREPTDEQGPSDRRVVVKPRKRKRERKTWELVLRPAPDRKPTGKQGRGKPTVWMVHDTADLQQSRKAPQESQGEVSNPPDEASGSQGMEWLAAQQSHPPLEDCRFTFRCYIRDISPRTRPTNIFPPQACEVILTTEESYYLREGLKGKPVSISYLAEEGEMLKEVKKYQEEGDLEEQKEAMKAGDK